MDYRAPLGAGVGLTRLFSVKKPDLVGGSLPNLEFPREQILKRIRCHENGLVSLGKLAVEGFQCIFVAGQRITKGDLYRGDAVKRIDDEIDLAVTFPVSDINCFPSEHQINQVLEILALIPACAQGDGAPQSCVDRVKFAVVPCSLRLGKSKERTAKIK